MSRPNAIPVSKALGADDVIPLDDSDVEKELQLHDKYVKYKHYLMENFIIKFTCVK